MNYMSFIEIVIVDKSSGRYQAIQLFDQLGVMIKGIAKHGDVIFDK